MQLKKYLSNTLFKRTKMNVYKTIIILTLLYGVETMVRKKSGVLFPVWKQW